MNYRKKANLILFLVLISFITALLIKRLYPLRFSVNLVYYVTEAALVGGIADWFAVTALFKKPLGWPYHTALIPRNRAKLIEAVAHMVKDDLLSLQLLKNRIAGVDFAGICLDRVEHSGYLDLAAPALSRYLSDKINRSPAFAESLSNIIKDRLAGISFQTLLRQGFFQKADDNSGNSLEDTLFAYLPKIAARPATRETIYAFLLDQLNQKRNSNRINKFTVSILEKTNLLDLDEAADMLQLQLVASLKQMRQSGHPTRQYLAQELRKAVLNLASSPAAGIERQIPGIIDQLPWEECVQSSLQKLTVGRSRTSRSSRWDDRTCLSSAALELPCSSPNSKVSAAVTLENSSSKLESLLADVLQELWLHLKNSTTLRNQLNQSALTLITGLLETHHSLIGDTVRQTLNSLSDAELNSFIEDKAGEDLQWIRINGSLIGGIAGLVIFLVLNLVVNPYLLPLK